MMIERQTTNILTRENIINSKTKGRMLNKRKISTTKKFPIGILVGIVLTLITIILQCVAFFTPHWKEVSPNTYSLYVDGVDALIRTEVLHYFNNVHRYTRHSYGLFQRCEYNLANSSIQNQHDDLFDFVTSKPKKCTKNFLPTYRDDHFNKCHSMAYYRFCAKSSEKNFDVHDDYLRASSDVSSLSANFDSAYSCDCYYPPYTVVCHVVGILALIFLFITCSMFFSFPFFTKPHHRLKIKSFGIISSILSTMFLCINLIIILKHFEYESIEYLIAIKRHYKSNQIYKLSNDAKTAIDRFLSSINIRVGYSTIIAWIAFFMSIIDGILLVATCKIKNTNHKADNSVRSVDSQDEKHQNPLKYTLVSNDFQHQPTSYSLTNDHEERTLLTSEAQNRGYQASRMLNADEV